MSLTITEVLTIAAVLTLGLWLATRRRKPMATWKRRGFKDYGDDPADDSRSSIDNFKRSHRY